MSYDFNSDVNQIDELKKQKEQEHADVFEQLLTARKNTERTVVLNISGLPIRVYKNMPLDIEQKILDYKKTVEGLGDDYAPESILEAKKPLYLIVASLCSEKPYNEPVFWEIYDQKSNGDVSNLLDDLYSGLKKMKKR